MPFSTFKHGIQTSTDTITGDAGLAINGNFVAIGNLFDSVLTSPVAPSGLTINGPGVMSGPSNPSLTLTSDGFGNAILTNQGGGPPNLSNIATLSCQSVTSSNTLHALGAIVAANGITYGDATVQTTAATPLPSQASNAGKFLSTNGTTTSWATVAAGVTSVNGRTGDITLTSTDIAGLGTAALLPSSSFDAAGAAASATASALQRTSNLSDLSNPSTARTNLGLGSAATMATGAFDLAGTAATAAAGVLPSQTSHAGQYLTTSGTSPLWTPLPTASGTVAGLMSAANFTKLSGLPSTITTPTLNTVLTAGATSSQQITLIAGPNSIIYGGDAVYLQGNDLYLGSGFIYGGGGSIINLSGGVNFGSTAGTIYGSNSGGVEIVDSNENVYVFGNGFSLNGGTGFGNNSQMSINSNSYVALDCNGEVDIGSGGTYSDPSPGYSYDLKCGGENGGITSQGSINSNTGFQTNNAQVIDYDGNVYTSTIYFNDGTSQSTAGGSGGGSGSSTFSTLTVDGNNGGNITIEAFPGHTAWIDMPAVSGYASGIGSGGPGSNPWIAYAGNTDQWFSNSATGDVCYRNTGGRLLFGASNGGTSQMIITSTTMNIATAGTLGFFGVSAVSRPTVTGSRSSGAALTSLLTALASLGLIVNSSTT